MPERPIEDSVILYVPDSVLFTDPDRSNSEFRTCTLFYCCRCCFRTLQLRRIPSAGNQGPRPPKFQRITRFLFWDYFFLPFQLIQSLH